MAKKRGLHNKGDFDKLKFNVFDVKEGTDLNNHFRLDKLIPSFANYADADRNRVIRYIIYMYDSKSPLAKYFTDITRRKEESASLAGFDLVKNKSRLELLFDLEEDLVGRMVVDFLRYQNNRLWSMIISNEQAFYEFTKTLLTLVRSEKGDKDKLQAVQVKTKLMEDLDAVNDRLNKYYDQLYGDSVIREIASGMGVTPEEIALGN